MLTPTKKECYLFQFSAEYMYDKPDAAETGRAVWAVLGVRKAWSIVPGRPPCDPGRTTPLRGRPDCVAGLPC